jgi:hypothetical protein
MVLGELMKMNRSLGSMEGKIDHAIELHETCPARLGFDKLKETTSRLRIAKDGDSDMPLSLVPIGRGKVTKTTVIWVLSLALAIMFGIAFAGYTFGKAGAPPPRPAQLPDALTDSSR